RLSGGDMLRLSRARDRLLGDLRSGLSLDRDVPAFIRARATGFGDPELVPVLVAALSRLWESYGRAARKRSALEAPPELTETYARRLFAYGSARLGQRDLSAALARPKAGDADKSDPVHGVLLAMLDERIRQGQEGLAPTAPLPSELQKVL